MAVMLAVVSTLIRTIPSLPRKTTSTSTAQAMAPGRIPAGGSPGVASARLRLPLAGHAIRVLRDLRPRALRVFRRRLHRQASKSVHVMLAPRLHALKQQGRSSLPASPAELE